MPTRDLMRRIEKLEKSARERKAAEAESKESGHCICFPLYEPPVFETLIHEEIARRVLCPVHGKRTWLIFNRLYLPDWRREILLRVQECYSPKFKKGWDATFPPDLFPAKEVKTEQGICLWFRNGTRMLAENYLRMLETRAQPPLRGQSAGDEADLRV